MDADHDSYQDILKDLKLLVGGHLGVLHKLFCFARSQNFGTQETCARKEPTESKRERTSKKIVRDSERESVSQEEDKQAPASSKANAKRNGEHSYVPSETTSPSSVTNSPPSMKKSPGGNVALPPLITPPSMTSTEPSAALLLQARLGIATFPSPQKGLSPSKLKAPEVQILPAKQNNQPPSPKSRGLPPLKTAGEAQQAKRSIASALPEAKNKQETKKPKLEDLELRVHRIANNADDKTLQCLGLVSTQIVILGNMLESLDALLQSEETQSLGDQYADDLQNPDSRLFQDVIACLIDDPYFLQSTRKRFAKNYLVHVVNLDPSTRLFTSTEFQLNKVLKNWREGAREFWMVKLIVKPEVMGKYCLMVDDANDAAAVKAVAVQMYTDLRNRSSKKSGRLNLWSFLPETPSKFLCGYLANKISFAHSTFASLKQEMKQEVKEEPKEMPDEMYAISQESECQEVEKSNEEQGSEGENALLNSGF